MVRDRNDSPNHVPKALHADVKKSMNVMMACDCMPMSGSEDVARDSVRLVSAVKYGVTKVVVAMS